MLKENFKLAFDQNIKLKTLNQQYIDQGFIKIEQALTTNSAQKLQQYIEKQKQWNLVFNNQGQHQDLDNLAVAQWTAEQKRSLEEIINHQAETGFQYYYETIPIYDIYIKNIMQGHFFNQIIEFLNTKASLDFFRTILSAPEISFVDGQITRFNGGHFLNCHNDDVKNKNRVAAMVINLTKHWRADWGGALHLLDENHQIKQSFLPTFNEINIFKVPVDHYVGYVSPFAKKPRLSITCWLRFGESPFYK
jgi:Rps23 Pro-64 3,4-dihydroxylase Tpa1-like proline 4-hydroxylase